jgi:DNA-binding HxlR family transcriptional regulator
MKDLQCPAYDAIQILQEKWVLLIVRSLLDGSKGFNELGREIGGCNPTTLAQRLERLEQLGLVSKKVEAIMPPKSSYSLTDSGRGLQCVVEAIHVWAVTYLPDRPLVKGQLSERSLSEKIAVAS